MSDKTGIEWTDATWNPTKGCDRVSPGCDNCYAMTQAKRLKAMGSPGYQLDGDPRTSGPGFLAHEWPDALDRPLRWTRPRRIFVDSMADLFHDRISDAYIARVFAVMALAPQHTFQVLTKRHGRMRHLLSDGGSTLLEAAPDEDTARALYENLWPLPHVWLGVSVEDQKRADLRIPALLDTPAAVRFLSCEPLLGPVDLLSFWLEPRRVTGRDRTGIDWVIVGGESGPGARPMHPGWARQLRDQCTAAGVPFLFKQWGNWAPVPTYITDIEPGVSRADGRDGDVWLDGTGIHRTPWAPETRGALPGRWDPFGDTAVRDVGKHTAGRELDGRTWDQYPA